MLVEPSGRACNFECHALREAWEERVAERVAFAAVSAVVLWRSLRRCLSNDSVTRHPLQVRKHDYCILHVGIGLSLQGVDNSPRIRAILEDSSC